MAKLSLKSVICPGCAAQLPIRNKGCPDPDCGYEDGVHGRILPLNELVKLPSAPEAGAAKFNQVSPKFLAMVIAAAQAEVANHG